jgi:hypothetical protein
MEIRPLGAEFFHADRPTDTYTTPETFTGEDSCPSESNGQNTIFSVFYMVGCEGGHFIANVYSRIL